MARSSFVLVLLLSALASFPAAAEAQTDRDEVLAVMERFFTALGERDTATMSELFIDGAHMVSVEVAGDDAVATGFTFPRMQAMLAGGGPPMLERMWDPQVMVDGPIAVVWTPYDFHIDGRFSHCGTDVFMLARTGGVWKITGASWTVQPTGCESSPLGEP